MKFNEKHIGCRIQYTGRNGNVRYGKLKGFAGPSSARMVDLKLDNSTREHFYVPEDACVLVPDELDNVELS